LEIVQYALRLMVQASRVPGATDAGETVIEAEERSTWNEDDAPEAPKSLPRDVRPVM
jgi:hypothetical protein